MYDACVPWPERPKGAKDKSRGPKGLELEVGARRAPKLLVFFNILFLQVFHASAIYFGIVCILGVTFNLGIILLYLSTKQVLFGNKF